MSDVHHTGRWQRLRANSKRTNKGLCANPWGFHRELRLLDEVHHIIPVSIAPEAAHVPRNLVALCSECHKKAHKRRFLGSRAYWLPFGGLEVFLERFNELKGMGSKIAERIKTDHHTAPPPAEMHGVFTGVGSKITGGMLQKGKSTEKKK